MCNFLSFLFIFLLQVSFVLIFLLSISAKANFLLPHRTCNLTYAREIFWINWVEKKGLILIYLAFVSLVFEVD